MLYIALPACQLSIADISDIDIFARAITFIQPRLIRYAATLPPAENSRIPFSWLIGLIAELMKDRADTPYFASHIFSTL
jgi:hypothetical protein